MVKGRPSRFFFLFLSVLMIQALPLIAQEEDEPDNGDIPFETDWSGYMPAAYAMGDQTFIITLGTVMPAFFSGPAVETQWFFSNNIKIGGAGSLAYNFFLNSHIFIGGELGGMFAGTLGENMLFVIPFGFRAGYQAVLGRFEFPITLMVGGAPQKKLDEGYFGLVVKGGASAFWRFNTDWSFGLNTAWWWLPQWTKKSEESMQGNMLEVTISARYHF